MDQQLSALDQEHVENEGLPEGPPLKKAKLAENDEEKSPLARNLWNTLCGACKEVKGKYRCPGCEEVTCSLKCTESHKSSTGCKGTRRRTAFVPMSKFNEMNFLSDVHLLDDMNRVKQNVKREQTENDSERLSKRFKFLQQKSKLFGLKLHFLPSIMSKHRQNSTRFDNTTQTFIWHVELHFTLLNQDHTHALSGLNDSLSAPEAIQAILAHPSNQLLSTSVSNCYPADTSLWRFFLLQPMCPANKPLFHPLLPSSTIRQALAHTDILEYPTIYVTSASDEANFELFSDDKYKSRSENHFASIETLAREVEDDSSDTSDSSDSEEDSSDESSSDSSSSEASHTEEFVSKEVVVSEAPPIQPGPLVSRYRRDEDE